MQLLGLNNKPLVAGGKAIIPPTAGSGVDIQYDTITPDRYTVDLDNRTCYLNLNGLITHKFFYVQIDFNGEALDNENLLSTGETINYYIFIQYVDEKDSQTTNSIFYYVVPGMTTPLLVRFTDNSSHILDLGVNGFLFDLSQGGEYGLALSISTVIKSTIISWD